MSQEPTGTTEPTAADPANDPAGEPVETKDTLGAIAARLGPAAALGGTWAVLPALGGIVLLWQMPQVSEWLRGEAGTDATHLTLGVVVYIAVFMITAGFGLLPTYAQALLAGYAFGTAIGFPAALAGFGGASLVGYVLARRVGRKQVQAELARHPKASAIRDALLGGRPLRALGIITLIRVSPNSPFALTNLVLATSGVPPLTFLAATLVGMAPRTLAAVMVGQQITDWNNTTKPRWMIVGGIIITVAVFIILAWLANEALRRLHASTAATNTTPDLGDVPPGEMPEPGRTPSNDGVS